MIIGIVTTRSELARAKVLAQSVKLNNPEMKVVASLVERENDLDLSECPYFDEMVLARDTWPGQFEQWIANYSPKEACCAAKALLLHYIFITNPEENHVLLLDNDIEILAPLRHLRAEIEKSSVLLAPWLMGGDGEYDVLQLGSYNPGLIGVSRTPSGLAFARWWASRLERAQAFNVDDEKLVPEHQWLNLVHSLFEGVHELRHPGYNMADWHHRRRFMTLDENGHPLVDGEPMIIAQYHHLADMEKEVSDRSNAEERPVLAAMIKRYTRKLDAMGIPGDESKPWSYLSLPSMEPNRTAARRNNGNSRQLDNKHRSPQTAVQGNRRAQPPLLLAANTKSSRKLMDLARKANVNRKTRRSLSEVQRYLSGSMSGNASRAPRKIASIKQERTSRQPGVRGRSTNVSVGKPSRVYWRKTLAYFSGASHSRNV